MKFFQTLHGKLSAALLSLLVLVGVLLIPLTLFAVRGYTEEVAQQLNRPLAADLAKHLDTKNLLRANFASDKALQAAAKSEISKLMVLNPDIEIYILDTHGEVLAYSAHVEKLPMNRVALKPLRQFFAGQTLPIRGDDPLHLGGHKVFSAARIPDADGKPSADDLNGFVYIVLGSEAYQSVAQLTERSYALRGILWIMAGALVLVFGAGVLLFRVLTRPLRRLKNEMSVFQTQFAASHNGNSSHAARAGGNRGVAKRVWRVGELHFGACGCTRARRSFAPRTHGQYLARSAHAARRFAGLSRNASDERRHAFARRAPAISGHRDAPRRASQYAD